MGDQCIVYVDIFLSLVLVTFTYKTAFKISYQHFFESEGYERWIIFISPQMSLTLLHKMQINQKSLLVILYFHLEWVLSVNLVHIALEKKSKLTSNYGDFIRAAVLYHWHHKWLFVIAFGRIMSLWRTITTTFYHRMDWVELDLLTKDVTFDPKCHVCDYVILQQNLS